jgi:hypothetical protein
MISYYDKISKILLLFPNSQNNESYKYFFKNYVDLYINVVSMKELRFSFFLILLKIFRRLGGGFAKNDFSVAVFTIAMAHNDIPDDRVMVRFDQF